MRDCRHFETFQETPVQTGNSPACCTNPPDHPLQLLSLLLCRPVGLLPFCLFACLFVRSNCCFCQQPAREIPELFTSSKERLGDKASASSLEWKHMRGHPCSSATRTHEHSRIWIGLFFPLFPAKAS